MNQSSKERQSVFYFSGFICCDITDGVWSCVAAGEHVDAVCYIETLKVNS